MLDDLVQTQEQAAPWFLRKSGTLRWVASQAPSFNIHLQRSKRVNKKIPHLDVLSTDDDRLQRPRAGEETCLEPANRERDNKSAAWHPQQRKFFIQHSRKQSNGHRCGGQIQQGPQKRNPATSILLGRPKPRESWTKVADAQLNG